MGRIHEPQLRQIEEGPIDVPLIGGAYLGGIMEYERVASAIVTLSSIPHPTFSARRSKGAMLTATVIYIAMGHDSILRLSVYAVET